MLWCGVVSLFPEMFQALSEYGITKRAINKNLVNLSFFNPRDYTDDPHKSVDDHPYGGGPGMVMTPQPLIGAIQAAKAQAAQTGHPKVIYFSPAGKKLTQSIVQQEAKQSQPLIFVSGRYEGIDERVIEQAIDEQYSIGDYILTGGELPTMVVLDAIIRLLPGALGDSESATIESFSDGLLEYPHYTRPIEFNGVRVPEVLLSGNHAKIAQWREQQRVSRTQRLRSDLYNELVIGEKNE